MGMICIILLFFSEYKQLKLQAKEKMTEAEDAKIFAPLDKVSDYITPKYIHLSFQTNFLVNIA